MVITKTLNKILAATIVACTVANSALATPTADSPLYLGGAFIQHAGYFDPNVRRQITAAVGVHIVGKVEDGVLIIVDCHARSFENDGGKIQDLRSHSHAPAGLTIIATDPRPDPYGDNVGKATLEYSRVSGVEKPGKNTLRVTVKYNETFRKDGWWVSPPITAPISAEGVVAFRGTPVKLTDGEWWWPECMAW